MSDLTLSELDRLAAVYAEDEQITAAAAEARRWLSAAEAAVRALVAAAERLVLVDGELAALVSAIPAHGHSDLVRKYAVAAKRRGRLDQDVRCLAAHRGAMEAAAGPAVEAFDAAVRRRQLVEVGEALGENSKKVRAIHRRLLEAVYRGYIALPAEARATIRSTISGQEYARYLIESTEAASEATALYQREAHLRGTPFAPVQHLPLDPAAMLNLLRQGSITGDAEADLDRLEGWM